MKVNSSAIDRVIPQYFKLKGWKDVAGSGAVAVLIISFNTRNPLLAP